MTTASIADVKARLSSYVDASEKSPVFITRNGKAVAAIVSIGEEEDVERIQLSHSVRLREILDAAQERIRRGEGISKEELWKRLSQAPRRKSRKGG